MTEDEVWEKRFRELAKKSYDSGCYTFTPFLSPDKLALFYRMEKELSYAGYCLSGGVEGAERQVLRFGDAKMFGYEADFPIVCLLAEPCAPKFAIAENLTRVMHTDIRLTVLEEAPETAKPLYQEEQVIVSSERIDALIAKLYHLSRSESTQLFRAKKIFVGGRQCENAGYLCKDGDIVSVRGYGKFLVCGDFGITGKGRLRVTLKIYR